jgi:DNA replication and repair protein RecF
VWSEQLSELGARVMAARAKMVDELNSYMTNFYAAITNQKWTFRVVYNPNIAFQDTDQIKEKFDQALKRTRFKEKQRAKTIVGPHRDEFTFFISDNDLRKFGSRGEHKSALVSLKAAESQVLYKRTEIYPILLLDDLFAELDRQRSTKVLDLFDPSSQLFITGTTLDYVGMRESSDILNNQATFMVKNGAINRV